MPTKPKRAKPAKKRPVKRTRLTARDRELFRLYPSMRGTTPPSQSLAELLEEARKRGIGPMTKEKLRAMAGVWPEDEDLDEFLAWLRKMRREAH